MACLGQPQHLWLEGNALPALDDISVEEQQYNWDAGWQLTDRIIEDALAAQENEVKYLRSRLALSTNYTPAKSIQLDEELDDCTLLDS